MKAECFVASVAISSGMYKDGVDRRGGPERSSCKSRWNSSRRTECGINAVNTAGLCKSVPMTASSLC